MEKIYHTPTTKGGVWYTVVGWTPYYDKEALIKEFEEMKADPSKRNPENFSVVKITIMKEITNIVKQWNTYAKQAPKISGDIWLKQAKEKGEKHGNKIK